MEFTPNIAKERSKELTNHGQSASHEGKDLSSKFLPKASIIARTEFETDTNTLNVTFEGWNVIQIGQPNKERVSCNSLCCDQYRFLYENGPKERDSDDRSERQKGVRD